MDVTEEDVGAVVAESMDAGAIVLEELSKEEAPKMEVKDDLENVDKLISMEVDPGESSTSDLIISSVAKDVDPIDADLILSEVKEQVLKEVEEMKEMPSLDASAVSSVDIENLLEPKDLPQEPQKEAEHEEPDESNPQINIEDMKAAQEELRVLDIIVCGSCHQVVHFVEEFVSHKSACKGKSSFHGNIAETKSQVWAFLLWKNAQSKLPSKVGPLPSETSWKLYQKWCKMPPRIREAWITAGETIMNFTTFGYTKNGDAVLKTPTKKPEYQKLDLMESSEDDSKKPVVMRKLVQRDHAGEIKEIRPALKKINEDIESIRNQLEDGDSSQDKSIPEMDMYEAEPTRISFQKFPRVKPLHKEGPSGVGTVQEEEFVVEKIVSRRFNPRKKQYEYLLKWEGYPSEQNTWEPAENLEACQHLLKAFEDSLSKQSGLSLAKQPSSSIAKQPSAKPAARPLSTPTPKKPDVSLPGPSGLNSFGRPVRHSKQKALNQVKAWCGSIKPDDSELETLKRRAPLSDSEDDDEGIIKRIKNELDSDSEDSLGGRVYYNRTGGMSGIIKKSRGRPRNVNRGRPIQNGNASGDNLAAALGLESSGDEVEGKKMSALEMLNKKSLEKKVSSLSPANQQVLVANAKGVVKVDPSQVPNLSSGVYIMSNKSGIIKLDSVSPSKALSLKQGPVKEMTSPSKEGLTPTGSSGSVIMLNKSSPATPGNITRTGILRRNSLTPGRGGNTIIQRGIGRSPKPAGNIKITNSNTRLLHSGAAARASINATPSSRPKLPLKTTIVTEPTKKTLEIERRVLGSKVGRGGLTLRGGYRGRGGIMGNSISDTDKNKDKDRDSVFRDMPQDSPSSDSDAGIPDDFPVDLPPIEPESPPRPLTLCPETGKVLLKAEGEKTPEPTPPPSPAIVKQEEPEVKPPQPMRQVVKEERLHVTKPRSTKETVVKKSLGKPGSTGSVSISPKKIAPEVVEDDSEFVTITGEDGLLYKVSKAELNNSLLVGEDGQQCVYVTSGENGDESSTVLTLGGNYSDVSQLEGVNILAEGEESATQFYVKEGEEGELLSLEVQGEDGEEGQSQLVAQLVEAGEPAPGGGPRRVVLLLPDGNLMMTEVDEEQYAALELDKFQTSETAEME